MNWELLIRHIKAECTAEESSEVQAWLDEKPENKILLKQLEQKHKQLNQPLKDEVVHNEWTKVLDRIFEAPKPEEKPMVVRLFRLLSIAATVLVACCVTWFALKTNTNKNVTAEAVVIKTIKERRQVQLPDGSSVYLAPNSTLHVSGTFGKKTRELTLTGEAFFDVKHDAKRAFIIRTANNLKVNVLGTSFNVYSRKGVNEEIKVATGLVGFVAGTSTHFIKAGEQLNYFLTSRQANKSAVNVQDALSLQNGTLYFNNNNAAEIAAKLQRYYNIEVEVAHSAQKHPRFSGEMKDYGIAKLLDGLGFATGIRYKFKTPNSILLY